MYQLYTRVDRDTAVMVMVMVLNSAYTGLPRNLWCSSGAVHCFARASMFGKPFLAQHPLRWPARLGAPWKVPRAGDYDGMIL